MLMIKCYIWEQQPQQCFYLKFSDCPRLDEIIKIDNIDYVVLRVIKHTSRQEDCVDGFKVYTSLSTTITLSKRN